MRRTARAAAAIAGAAALTLGLAITPGVANAEERNITEATVEWGIQPLTFASYISRAGTISYDQVAENGHNYSWAGATGSFDPETGSGVIDLPGSVHYYAHGGILDLEVSHPRVVIESGSVSIVADASDAGASTLDDAAFATFTGTPVLSGDTLTFSSTGDALSAEAAAFFRNYSAGDPSAPLTFSVTLAALAPTPEPSESPSEDASEEPTATPTQQPTAQPTQQPSTAPSPSAKPTTQPTPTPSSQPTTAPSPKPTATTTTREVTTGSLAWGVKKSFTDYLRSGIANGSWTLSGATHNGSQFNWPLSEKDGSTYRFSGTVSFSGHDGVLQVSLRNPRIVVNGSNSATLVFGTVTTSNMQGEKSTFNNVSFATLSGPITATGGSNLSATLTADGAKAFAGFYEAGTALDALSFSVKTTTVTTSLPSTGADSGTGLAPLAALALVGALGVVVATRRRVKA